jgi:alanine dehydrogenase
LQADPHLRNGLNIFAGKVTHEAVANDQGLECVPPEKALGL